MKYLIHICAFLWLSGSAMAQSPLVPVEHAFAQKARDKGTRAAFLDFLSEDGIVFDDKPLNGKAFWKARKDSPGILAWEPIFGDLAASGNWGYTTGPWTYQTRADTLPIAFGDFVSIWKKGSDGVWKLAFDLGCDHPAPTGKRPDYAAAPAPLLPAAAKADTAGFSKTLLQADAQLAESIQRSGAFSAYNQHLSDHARLYRPGQFVITDTEGVQSEISTPDQNFSFEPYGSSLAASGELGCVYGALKVGLRSVDSTQWKTGTYLRIWKKEDGKHWKLALEVLSWEI